MHHVNLRKVIAPLLNSSAVLEFEATVKQYSTRLLEAIHRVAEENNDMVDMNDWFNRFAFDVIFLSLAFTGSRWRNYI